MSRSTRLTQLWQSEPKKMKGGNTEHGRKKWKQLKVSAKAVFPILLNHKSYFYTFRNVGPLNTFKMIRCLMLLRFKIYLLYRLFLRSNLDLSPSTGGGFHKSIYPLRQALTLYPKRLLAPFWGIKAWQVFSQNQTSYRTHKGGIFFSPSISLALAPYKLWMSLQIPKGTKNSKFGVTSTSWKSHDKLIPKFLPSSYFVTKICPRVYEIHSMMCSSG